VGHETICDIIIPNIYNAVTKETGITNFSYGLALIRENCMDKMRCYEMSFFRPISLLNCSFKIFSKALTHRFEKVCQRLIAKEHNAFIRGHFILESVVIAHEIVHSIHKTKEHVGDY
jgi:hypothetical protein